MRIQRVNARRVVLLSVIGVILLLPLPGLQKAASRQAPEQKDPAAWGGNHVGQPIPEFVHGDECLFCHRNTIGAHWQQNPHAVAVRQLEDVGKLADLLKQPEVAKSSKEIEYFLGSRNHVRFLRKDGYGKFQISSAHALLEPGRPIVSWLSSDSGGWDRNKFADKCAGCHATGIDSKAKTFAAFGLDCYTCHGNVNVEHSNNTALIILSKKRRNEAQIITSTCAQCHLRGGKSKSTGLPYPNTFIPGDNLFQDYEVDWKKADDESLNPGDRHIYRNVRDVALYGKEFPTCINCHQVHSETRVQAISRHKLPPRGPICFDCHTSETPIKGLKAYEVTSGLCEY